MGWSSYIEDVVSRYEQSLHMAENAIDDPGASADRIRREALNAFESARVIWNEIRLHLEVATDPDLDLAQSLAELRSELHKERSLNGDLRQKLKVLERGVAEANLELKLMQSEKEKLTDMFLAEKEHRESVQAKLDIHESLSPSMFSEYGHKDER